MLMLDEGGISSKRLLPQLDSPGRCDVHDDRVMVLLRGRDGDSQLVSHLEWTRMGLSGLFRSVAASAALGSSRPN